jgi:hypothetical protein
MRHFSNGLDGDWNQVSGLAPCPICGGDADCRTHSDEAFVCCVQQPSDWRLNNGGWLHRIATVSGRAGGVVANSVVAGGGAAGNVLAGSVRAGGSLGEAHAAGRGSSGVMS